MYEIDIVLKCPIFFLFLYRIGFVFILNTKEEIDGNEDAGIALWRMFNYIAEESDISQAFTSIINVSVFHKKSFLKFVTCLHS